MFELQTVVKLDQLHLITIEVADEVEEESLGFSVFDLGKARLVQELQDLHHFGLRFILQLLDVLAHVCFKPLKLRLVHQGVK